MGRPVRDKSSNARARRFLPGAESNVGDAARIRTAELFFESMPDTRDKAAFGKGG